MDEMNEMDEMDEMDDAKRSMDEPGEITVLLGRWGRGDLAALEDLMPLVTDELRSLARRYFLRQAEGHTLQPTALVNELYLRLAGQAHGHWPDRARFFSFAATIMRNILVDHARARSTSKRGAGVQKISIDEALDAAREPEIDVLALDEALNDLAALDRRQARIVELRAFAGLSVLEVAEVMETSRATVVRDWAMAKAWLFRRLYSEKPEKLAKPRKSEEER